MGKAMAATYRMTFGDNIARLKSGRQIVGRTADIGRTLLATLIHAAVMLNKARSARLTAHAISASLRGMTPGPHAVNRVGEPAKMKYARDVTTST